METDLRARARCVFLVSLAALCAIAAAAPFVGGSGMDYGKLARREAPDWQILVNLRIPRTLLALLAGASLSAAGALFQAILRDALATPSNRGVSAAASLGAVAAIALFPGEETGLPWVWISALSATAAVIALVATMRASARFSPLSLLLTGIAINGVCASIILLLHSLAGIARGFQITHWLMGGIDAVTYPVLAALAAAVIPVWIWILRMARVLNVMSYGDTWAAGRGVDCAQVTWQGFAAGAVLAGVTTAVTGPIAFVGLIVPHLLRRVTGPDYRVLMPACISCGGAFLIVCDTAARNRGGQRDVGAGCN